MQTLNALNQAIVTGRNTTVSLASPLDQTMVNLPFDPATGSTVVSRSLPKNAGFRRRQRLPGAAHAASANSILVLELKRRPYA